MQPTFFDPVPIASPGAYPAEAGSASIRLPQRYALSDQLRAASAEAAAELTCQLIAARSDKIETAALQVAEAQARRLLGRDMQVTRLEVTEGRYNLLLSCGSPEVLLCTHLDVVGGSDSLFVPRREFGKVIGRGACDAKGSAAAMLVAAALLKQRGISDFGLLFLVGEEKDHCGAIAACKQLADSPPHFIINGEPTDSRLVLGHLGSIGFELTVPGKAAHSAYSEFGIDANRRTVALAQRVYELQNPDVLPVHPVLGAARVNIGRFDSHNVSSGTVCPETVFRFMIRSGAPAERVRSLVADLVAQADADFLAQVDPRALEGTEADLHTKSTELYGLDPWSSVDRWDRDVALPGWGAGTVRYGTDLSFLSGLGAVCALLGPGSIKVAHTEHEEVDIEQLAEAVDAYVRLAEGFKYVESQKEKRGA